ncbi:MAG: hypothetical protein EXR73_10915 [Myxococcales bacterium]|nr:hypothetical protein [Myxococcales bacterium]
MPAAPRCTRADLAIAAALVIAVTATTLAAATQQGVNRDEAIYMESGEQYVAWAEHALSGALARPLSARSIDRYFDTNAEHPPLMKLLSGLSWRALHKCECASESRWHPAPARLDSGRHLTLPLLSEITAFRLPTALAFGLLAGGVYLFFLAAFGGRAGALAAALLTVLQPRAAFHAQTAAFDLPAATLWLLTTFAYFHALGAERRNRAALGVGVLYGLFLATKLQSFFLPFALGAHWLFLAVRAHRAGSPRPTLRPLVAMATIAPLVLIALWPHLWHDGITRFGRYLAFHWQHVHYNFEYLGTNYNNPPFPWHEPLGMLVTTAPVVLLALAAAGVLAAAGTLAAGARRSSAPAPTTDRAPLLLLLSSALVPIAPFFTGSTPIFGETKHWLATMPFLAIAAGLGFEAITRRIADEWSLAPRARAAVTAALLLVTALPAAAEVVRSHPYGLSHYNALAGGAPGGADLGMNRQFWGYSVRGLLDEWNRTLPKGTRIYPHDWNHPSYLLYLRDGLLRSDLVETGLEMPAISRSDVAVVIHELHFNKYEYMIWNAYGHARPDRVLSLDGVPLVTVYRRKP